MTRGDCILQHGIVDRIAKALGVCGLCCLLLFGARSFLHAGASGPMKPYLHECTHLEVEFRPSATEYFFSFPGDVQNLLNRNEMNLLESFTRTACKDQESIRAFAKDLRGGCYWGPAGGGEPATREEIRINYYLPSGRMSSLSIVGEFVTTEEGHRFVYDAGFPHLHLLTPELRPFELRAACAQNLRELYGCFPSVDGVRTYPNPSEWGDALLRRSRLFDLDRSHTKGPFECPSARTSHYAINPQCTPDSRGNTVLLFETTAGWNQHGGPELFTFDNHDPKGGCVVLNDGTVKFIRTEEELKQLRWK